MTLDAESAVLNIVGSARTTQYANDRAIENPGLDARVAANPGDMVGRQRAYYEGLKTRLEGQMEKTGPAMAVLPFKPKGPEQG